MTSAGVLHTYAPGLVAFEHLPSDDKKSSHKLLFVGGLGDGLFTVPFIPHLLGLDGWGVIEVLTSSSYIGWGIGSVKRDAAEIAKAVEYFRKSHPQSKIVLMGHSTGSQDAFQYLLNVASGSAPRLDGVILQASVSDREVIVMLASKTQYLTSINFSESWIKDGRGKEIIPAEMRPGFQSTPVCAERWYSLAAPLDDEGNPQGDEDFFSSDLNNSTLKETFGKLPTDIPIMMLYSEKDQCVPEFVDKVALLGRWKAASEAAGVKLEGVIVEGATHNLGDVSKEVMEAFVEKVHTFLKSLAEKGKETE